jgi:F0F1-type ATP synthase assembly protein I
MSKGEPDQPEQKQRHSRSQSDREFYTVLYQWYAKGSAIAFGMLVPALVGFGIDELCNTLPIGIISGTIVGCVFGFYQLIKSIDH